MAASVGCPADQVLSGFLDRALEPPAVRALEAHIDICPACRIALSHALRGRIADGGGAGAVSIRERERERENGDDDGLERIGSRVGRYQLLEVLGAGGMGVVYLARDPALDRGLAVKVLRADASGPGEGDERLRTEAQALARISHPNVLAVYDVGRVGRHRFVAMELVEGATLREVLARDVGWRERLRLLASAGRGLAAAHDVGVIHRDIKPDNVLVGADGRARVSDFGLARAAPMPRAAAVAPGPDDTGAASTAAGTLAYLAPELRDGARATAASDQFAFATMCWELLYDARPSPSPPLPRGGRESRRIAAVLQRGLAVDPEARWTSMTALIDAIDAAVRPAARLALLATVVLGTATVLGFALLSGPREDAASAVCAATVSRASELWSDARAQTVRNAFARSGAASASYAAVAVDTALRRTALDWSAAAGAACRRDPAGFVAGARPVECLERRHAQAAALAASFETADAAIVGRAAAAVAALAAPARCLDEQGPPEPPRPASWLALVRRLVAIGADIDLGRYDAAGTEADAVARDAETADAPALRSEALRYAAEVERVRGHYDESWRILTEAVATADRAGADWPRAQALIDLAWLAASDLMRPAEAAHSLTLARGSVARIGEPPALIASLEEAEAKLAMLRNDAPAAIDLLGHALSVVQQPLVEASLHNELAAAYLMVGRNAEALVELERVEAILEPLLGPDHSHLGALHASMAAALFPLHRLDEAEAHAERGVAIVRAALGDSRALAIGLRNLGAIRQENGHFDAAIAATEEALRMLEALLGPGHPEVAACLTNLGLQQVQAGHPALAAASFRRVVEILSATLGDDPAASGGEGQHSLVDALTDLAETELALGHAPAALATVERAIQRLDPSSTAEQRTRADDIRSRARRAAARER